MSTTLRYEHPIARKEHTCMWCGGKIAVGEQYGRQTLLYDGYLYEWKNHRECAELAGCLNMFAECGDEGLDAEYFKECVDHYIWEHHQNENDEIDEGWDLPTYYEKVRKILEEKSFKFKQK